ncbi:hypothetical protein [Methylobacterium sp. Leaf87]|uniref:hypothetical protein n=1 Tax=Methylobacterium sp. Leaf87 TaxID=1736243 RepID=UPI001FCCD281|nr:hypothetical protein [Methylobacterium sp. Leaf87]
MNSRPWAIPCRRATEHTDTPASYEASTIRTLSSNDQRRRRSAPSSTSTRIAPTR